MGNFVAERKHHLRMLMQRKLNEPNFQEAVNSYSSSSASGSSDGPGSLSSSSSLSSSDLTGESLYSLDLSIDDYAKIREMHVYQKAKEKLLASAQILNRMLQQDENYRSTSLNTEIFNKYISCTQDVPPNTSIDSNQFIEQLIDNTVARQRDCLRIIQMIINNNLANG